MQPASPVGSGESLGRGMRMGVCCFVQDSGAIHGGVSIVLNSLCQQCYHMQPSSSVGIGDSQLYDAVLAVPLMEIGDWHNV